MLQISLAQVRAGAGRLVATCLAIVIAVGFIVATLVLNATSHATIYRTVAAQYQVSDAVVTSDESAQTLLAQLERLPGVGATSLDRSTNVELILPGGPGRNYGSVQSIAADPSLRWEHLLGGRLPVANGEVAVANQVETPIGSTVTIVRYVVPADGHTATEVTESARVVGIVDQRGDPRAAGLMRLFATGAQTSAWADGDGATQIRIARSAGTSPAGLVETLRTFLREDDAPHAEVVTAQQAADDAVGSYTGDASSLTLVLLLFAGVALLVAMLVIANTFAVLLAQRTRELALLRCVGASGSQVRRGILIESLVIGLVASAAGVAGGIAAAAGLVRIAHGTDLPIPVAGLTVPLSAVLVGLLAGTLTTLVAALLPAHRATQVSPLAAMRPVDVPAARSRAGLLRLGFGLLLLIPGFLILGAGASHGSLEIGFLGGVLSFLGVMLAARRLVPAVVGRIGRRLALFGGVPGELAGLNAVRNPQRTAATALALLIGVTLTTTMVVGAATTRASALAVLDDHYPADVVVHSSVIGPLPKTLQAQLAGVQGVAGTYLFYGATVTGPDGVEQTVQAPWGDRGVLRSDPGYLERGTVDMPDNSWGSTGQTVTLTAGQQKLTYRIRVLPELTEPRMGLEELHLLVPGAGVDSIAIRLTEAAMKAPGRPTHSIADVVAGTGSGAYVTGPALERAQYDRLLDILLLIVTALLMVAVIIAVIGVGNTIALSVIERRQENGLLRALGLTRRQLRLTLLWEAALIAGVAAAIGVVLGVVYGITGTASVLGGEATGGITVSLPIGQIALIVVAATLAGALASVLPARRAARTSPVAAMSAV